LCRVVMVTPLRATPQGKLLTSHSREGGFLL
jgi:hypothetical protein